MKRNELELELFDKPKAYQNKRGSIAQWLAYLRPDSAAPGLMPNIPEKFSEEKNYPS